MQGWTDFLCWVEKHPGLASWMQAVGALIALAIAIGVPWWQKKQAAKQAKEAEDLQLRHLLRNLQDEMAVASGGFFEASGEHLLSSTEGTPFHVTIPLLEHPFPIYEACGPQLGRIPDEDLRRLVISAYSRAIGFAASIRFNNQLIMRYEHADYLAVVLADDYHVALRTHHRKALATYGDSLRASYKLALKEVETMQAGITAALS
jgi:hypothetical protein